MSVSKQPSDAYPIGTLVYYGPDADTITKVTASVVTAEDSPPIQRSWEGEGVAENTAVAAEIGSFFRQQGIRRVVMTDRVVGCPHVEGVDYPMGEDCPYCPYWKDHKTQPDEGTA